MGCAALVAAARAPRVPPFLALAAALVLSGLLVVFGTGPGESDAKINLLGFQPVEVIKVLVVLFLAGYLSERWAFLRDLQQRKRDLPPWMRRFAVPRVDYALPPLLAMAGVLGFFFLQRDLGPALVCSSSSSCSTLWPGRAGC